MHAVHVVRAGASAHQKRRNWQKRQRQMAELSGDTGNRMHANLHGSFFSDDLGEGDTLLPGGVLQSDIRRVRRGRKDKNMEGAFSFDTHSQLEIIAHDPDSRFHPQNSSASDEMIIPDTQHRSQKQHMRQSSSDSTYSEPMQPDGKGGGEFTGYVDGVGSLYTPTDSFGDQYMTQEITSQLNIHGRTAASADPLLTGGKGGRETPSPVPEKQKKQKLSKVALNRTKSGRFVVSDVRPRCPGCPLINPKSARKIAWDIYMAVLILYSVCIVPYRLGFDEDAKGAMKYFDYTVDICFGLDMIASFMTGYWIMEDTVRVLIECVEKCLCLCVVFL